MSISAHHAAFVRDLVQFRSAIVLDASKLYLLETRLAPIAASNGFTNIDDLIVEVRKEAPRVTGSGRDPAPLQKKIVEALTTNETSFFRDVWPFEALRRVLLPAFVERRVWPKIWCAACSTGQEPYSIAMLIAEHFPSLAERGPVVVATDLSDQVLARAAEGRYSQLEMNRGLPATYMVRHFDRAGTEWRVKPAVRRLVEFSSLNLLDQWPLRGAPDIVFMRNVLIYFDHPTKVGLLRRVRETLAPSGALFLGAAESPIQIDDAWDRRPFEKWAYYGVKS
ncbi:MAG: protein-glutamate O-methyltransferase CheR [Polyangiaceae bacterium]